MKKPHETWLLYANDDLRFAKSGLHDGFYSHVCFLSQQAVEKSLKAFIIFKGMIHPKTHRLPELANLLNEPWLNDYHKQLQKIDHYYMPMRYPDMLAALSPNAQPTHDEAKQALDSAEELVELIEKVILKS